VPNLQVINRDAHAAKCASEANDRRTRTAEIVKSPESESAL
jgi:hypothetical protein